MQQPGLILVPQDADKFNCAEVNLVVVSSVRNMFIAEDDHELAWRHLILITRIASLLKTFIKRFDEHAVFCELGWWY